MAEYIEREVLHQSLKKLADETDCNIAVLPDVADLIREAPAADVAPVKHGRWKLENDYQSRCTNCQKTSWVDHDDEPNYRMISLNCKPGKDRSKARQRKKGKRK